MALSWGGAVRRSARLLVLGSATALAIAMPAAITWFAGAAGAAAAPVRAESPHALFKMTITAIDRNGATLSNPSASVDGVNGTTYLSGGNKVQVPAGTYEVAAAIWRPADGDTQTLVAKTVHVTGNTSVTLDAQGAVPLSASTSVAGVTQGDQTIELCIGSGSSLQSVTGFLVDSAGTVYVKPMTASVLRTVYQTYWQNTVTGTIYDLAGAHLGGIPSKTTVYQASPSAMATVHVQLRDFENVTPLQSVIESYQSCGSMTLPVSSLPSVYTEYRTPGSWNTNLDFGPSVGQVQRDLFKTASYKAGHSYTDLFGSAVAGPSPDFPAIDGHDVVYSPVSQFSDPVVGLGFDCEGQADVSLYRGATQVGSDNITFCNSNNTFTQHVKTNGWYTMYSRALRFNPTGSVPSQILSQYVDLTWRFKFSPVTGHPVDAQAAPVTVTRFEPQRLNADNEAVGGKTTTLKFVTYRGGGQPVPTPRYRLRTVQVQASFNNGVTWQTITVSAHGSYWLAQVPGPAYGAYVSLRSIVTDSHGDSTTETIYRAYRVNST